MDTISHRNCRICLSQCENRDLDIAQFASKYHTCTGFQIKESDVPKKICSTCTTELISASNFQAKCKEAEEILKTLRVKCTEEQTLEASVKEFNEIISEMQVQDEMLDFVRVEPSELPLEVSNVSETKTLETVTHPNDIIVTLSNEEDTEEYEQITRLCCDFCEYEVASSRRIFDLKSHVKKCHADVMTELKCAKCPITFHLQSLLNFHIKECHSQNSIKDHVTCTFCSSHSLRAETIQRHVATQHKDAEVFSCIICQKNFRTMDHLRLHIRQTLCGTNILADSEIDFDYEIKCDYCAFTCALEANMKYHVEKMHPNQELLRCACKTNTIYCKDLAVEHLKYKCNSERQCETFYRTVSVGFLKRKPKLTQDIDGLTPLERKQIRQKETIECEFCHEKIKRASLQRHINNTHRGIKYFCTYCDKSYTIQSNLRVHIAKQHLNKKTEYPCEYCDRTFHAWQSRYYHMIRIHTKKFKFTCEFCNKNFIQQADYEDHTSIHTGAKIRECNECQEMFPTRDSLRTHKQNAHRKDPPVRCHLCGKVFMREILLQKHLQRMHAQNSDEMMQNDEINDQEEELDEYEEAERFLVEYIKSHEMHQS